jgi:hypothetical protein
VCLSNLDQFAATRARQRDRRFALSVRLLRLRRPHAINNFGDFVIIASEQIILADQCVLDAGELQPPFARPRAEVAERTDRLLARSLLCRGHSSNLNVLAQPNCSVAPKSLRKKWKNGSRANPSWLLDDPDSQAVLTRLHFGRTCAARWDGLGYRGFLVWRIDIPGALAPWLRVGHGIIIPSGAGAVAYLDNHHVEDLLIEQAAARGFGSLIDRS